MRALLEKTTAIVRKHHQILDATGGRFNLFEVIGVTTAETRLHSAFITELLDPKGSHGLKDKPLKAFIRHCLEDDFEFKTEGATSKAEHYIGVKTEKEGGQIDIIVRDNQKRAIIIENKINAGDQEYQMLRYYNHSKTYKDSRLIYLSLDGKQPTAYSTGGEEFNCITLSYRYEIINWLTECKQLAVDFPLVREAINHYINLIKQLTNTSLMDNMNQEIVEMITHSPENMQNAFELAKTLNNVKIRIQWEFWKQLQQALGDQGLKIKTDDPKHVEEEKVRGYYEKTRNKNIYYGLWIEVYNQAGITVHWGCEVEETIYSGFTIEKDGVGGISDRADMKPYRDVIMEYDGRYQSNQCWLGWQNVSPELDFKMFDSEAIFSLADPKKLKEITESIALQAKNDIDQVMLRLANKEVSEVLDVKIH